ncbi:MAG: hypothetical protein BWX80_03997 [Candidatus Hydrogenedentes bacterium ADurb.Bin101]|nr:MAG: hypothetical protein BWX80_03997 [Candidatus Hydrogenedentes bacterium ADurb.Bin101]
MRFHTDEEHLLSSRAGQGFPKSRVGHTTELQLRQGWNLAQRVTDCCMGAAQPLRILFCHHNRNIQGARHTNKFGRLRDIGAGHLF